MRLSALKTVAKIQLVESSSLKVTHALAIATIRKYYIQKADTNLVQNCSARETSIANELGIGSTIDNLVLDFSEESGLTDPKFLVGGAQPEGSAYAWYQATRLDKKLDGQLGDFYGELKSRVNA